jgi:hypothetical protein
VNVAVWEPLDDFDGLADAVHEAAAVGDGVGGGVIVVVLVAELEAVG